MTFSYAIVRTPGKSLIDGLTGADLGKPVYERAIQQHAAYVATLRACRLAVTVLAADERYPDSTFVEDTAVLTDECAIITNPGAPTRQGEEQAIRDTLASHFRHFERIQAPGTLEGGDIMRVGRHFYIGRSARTNEEGARQLAGFLAALGYTSSTIPVRQFLHLKTGMTQLDADTILLAGEFQDRPEFTGLRRILVTPEEDYAVNCLCLNGFVVMPAGFPKTRAAIEAAGFQVKETPMSEFRKIDGGLTCLSLRG
ncbi:MAG: N(G),N(G)-dimethylarginine dimethylaminohydrolase [Spirochaetes bacterium GWD1_61_31]|nr:MAG: N(G),N(G)-dimethylarginine dimethylaminohydrolase [Spirochaetes bacterium GWB1_60_80]OHD31500.1 MAG: N(G),N(G)-dimethylarginine dimethylaminohydrolase [Spirochaetes bacterium GWC1_61_12]OHD43276.1 MAG: N(G),N(G)-dimethylarginine dimethylaminohydrolase [Spirochaetes bacterium GWD1_61_31]OHD45634.1 MAG: N(G),N(G)-dimethylarginine dimethylaminohydrolase [Spirochaetes bacterium GWE1_60_18]OHD60485.1 MAG: N(G),N(G)-dimethylarginine dimethylaminohydrolase [Spirochaetes bacterium GWF1_60_12]H